MGSSSSTKDTVDVVDRGEGGASEALGDWLEDEEGSEGDGGGEGEDDDGEIDNDDVDEDEEALLMSLMLMEMLTFFTGGVSTASSSLPAIPNKAVLKCLK